MKKIGLCMAFTGTNYGQLLQAYATQQVVERMGYDSEIIVYRSGRNKGIKPSFASLVVSGKAIAAKLKPLISKPTKTAVLDQIHKENVEQRRKAADAFRSERLHNVVRCEGITELRNKSWEYTAVMVGSDQVWLPDIAVTNYFTLRFAAPGVRRISYATSMGVSSYPNYAKKPAADYWRQIDYLSVREEQAKNIIQGICDVDVTVVADPTYLLTAEEWEVRIPREYVIADGYVLCYFLGDDERIKRYARRYAQEKGLRLVSILSDECQSDDAVFADEVITGVGPDKFVNLIRSADCVLTDSFHGLAFSVIHERQFLVFYRKRNDVKESRNSRIDNIVKTWGLENRLIRDPENGTLDTKDIDYTSVTAKRMKFREESLSFLRNALDGR